MIVNSHDRRLILIVGMHRSGTSLLSSMLAGLGVTLPGQRIPADAANPEGYHEWDRIVELQERTPVQRHSAGAADPPGTGHDSQGPGG